MQLILTQDVKGKGKAGDLIKVNDGYARNYLLPRGLAIEANRTNMEQARQQANAQQHKQAVAKADAEAMAKKMGELVVTVRVRTGEGGKLFGSVTNKEIAEQLEAQHAIVLDKKKIELDSAIKSVGEYSALARLFAGVSAQFKVIVEAE